jgi:hypothetical protein
LEKVGIECSFYRELEEIMAKLNKNNNKLNTVEAYMCQCIMSSSCSCGCWCACEGDASVYNRSLIGGRTALDTPNREKVEYRAESMVIKA